MLLDFAWLGQSPAIDLANTYVPGQNADMLGQWPPLEQSGLPTETWRTVRDAVRATLRAVAHERPLAADAIQVLNRASASAPVYTTLEEGQLRTHEPLIGAVARDALALAAVRAPARACPAPGCGMFFMATGRRKNWCSPGCGNRARVARHYRAKKRSRDPARPRSRAGLTSPRRSCPPAMV
jgi:predicted RNA-binding Zn ribbon-like protein